MSLGRASFAIRVALAGLLAGAAPLAAQQASSPPPPTSNSAAPATNTAAPVIGPRELKDFSLGGTVTRAAEQPPAPAPAPAATAPAATASRGEARARTAESAAVKQPETVPTLRPSRPAPTPNAPFESTLTPAEPVAVAVEAAAPEIAAPPPTAPPSPSWPWLLAALALAGGGGLLLWRKRKAPAEPAYAGVSEPLSTPDAAPAPAPAPAPRASAVPLAGGIVARSLEPKLALEFQPLRADYSATGEAALMFELTVTNSGSAPARQVLIEGKLVNAGPDFDSEVAQFFRSPVAMGDRIPVIMPMAKVSVRSRVVLGPDRLAPIEVEGRKLLVPVVAFNALYKSASGDKQDSASYLVGRDAPNGGKMGPLPLDRGPRSWSALGARPHSNGLAR